MSVQLNDFIRSYFSVILVLENEVLVIQIGTYTGLL